MFFGSTKRDGTSPQGNKANRYFVNRFALFFANEHFGVKLPLKVNDLGFYAKKILIKGRYYGRQKICNSY